jgi:hypothetical protein
MRSTTPHHLVMPAASSGALIAVYLLLRPYGDAGSATSPEAAAAYASSWWVVAHLAGALGLVQLGRVGLRIDDLLASPTTMVARWSGLAGMALVLPVYGAETFGLHALGQAAVSDPSVMSLVGGVRGQEHPAGMTSFALGLLLLAVSGISTAVAWRGAVRSGRWTAPAWAGWPLGVAAALVLPQFLLPPAGRVAFGLAYAAAAAVLAVAARRARPSRMAGGQSPTVCLPRATTLRSGA